MKKMKTIDFLEDIGYDFGNCYDAQLCITKIQKTNDNYYDDFGDEVFTCNFIQSETCCGVCELSDPYIIQNKKFLKDAVNYALDYFADSFIITYLLEKGQKKQIEFLKKVGFKTLTTFKNKNTQNNLVCLYRTKSVKKKKKK